MRALVVVVLLLAGVASAQQPLADSIYHFSFFLPTGWTYIKIDSTESLTRFVCSSPDRLASLEVHALKTADVIDLDRFVAVITSEEAYGKTLGVLKDSSEVLLNGTPTIRRTYLQKNKWGLNVNASVFILAKERFGYILLFRSLQNVDVENEIKQITQTFDIQIPQPDFTLLLIIISAGFCLIDVALGVKRAIGWVRPWNVNALLVWGVFIIISLSVPIFMWINLLWVGVIVSLAIFVCMLKLPDATPVIAAYENAKSVNKASEYRKFCHNYRSSKRFYADAIKRMHALMDDVIKSYKDTVAGVATPIIHATLSMFEYIKRSDNFRVGVIYTGNNKIEDLLVQFAKLQDLKVLPASSDFTEEKNRRRERFITALINFAFHKLTPEDILTFSTADTPTVDQITFEVRYTISESGAQYYLTSEACLPERSRTYFTGVEFDWELVIRIPHQGQPYHLTLQSRPADQFSTRGKEINEVYNAMANSAFSDFCLAFIRQSGLAPIVYSHLVKTVIDQNGQPQTTVNITPEDVIRGLAEFSVQGEEVAKEVAMEFMRLIESVATDISHLDISGDVDTDAASDD